MVMSIFPPVADNCLSSVMERAWGWWGGGGGGQ